MRILWVKAGRILPVDSGGRIRSYNLARQLLTRHDFTFLSYYDGATDRIYEDELRTAFPGAVAISTGVPTGGMLSQGMRYVRHAANAAPYAVTKFAYRPVAQMIAEWDARERFDVMICDFLSASLNVPRTLRTPTVLFQHNVESALWSRQAAHEQNPLRRLVFSNEARKMARYERQAVKQFHHVIAVSEHDRGLMSEMTSGEHISVVPTGVDLSLYRTAAGTAASDQVVTFLGSMDWDANVDGVAWFCETIWPRVVAAVPGAKFRIVGRNPDARIKVLASDSIDVVGRVPSVIEYLKETAVFVVPLRVGGGTRLKIFEAMAAGRAVVSTRVGAEGLSVTHGDDVMLEDEPEAFARAVTSLLRNADERRALELSAAKTAARYDWSEIVLSFEIAMELARVEARRDMVGAAN